MLIGLTFVSQVKADIAKPSIPEFTVQIVNHSYQGKKATIEVTIKNQPFTSYKENGKSIALYYNICHKLHSEDWQSDPDYTFCFPSSKDEFTVKSYDLRTPDWNFSYGNLIDIQVEAIAGYYTVLPFPTPFSYIFIGEASSWSNAQTITIPEPYASPTQALINSFSPSPTAEPTTEPTSTPKQTGVFGTTLPNEYGYAIVAMMLAVVVPVVTVLVLRKRKNAVV
jgi:hypothetical protein